MKGYKINSDMEYVQKIINGLQRKNGHCPCRVNVDETTLCPCDEFIKTGVCKCKLYISFEEAEKKLIKLENND